MPGIVEPHPASKGDPPPLAPLLDEVVSALAMEDKDVRAHVFIEAPAGRGKSALLRAVMERLITDFEIKPSGPLPVLCPRTGSEIEKIVLEELGRHGFSEAVVKAQLKRGLLVIAVDALDEAAWPAESLKRIITGPYDDARVVVASRPSTARREAFSHAERWKRVEPIALDKDTIALFEAAYLAADQKVKILSHPLDARMRMLCQIDDAHYSPLLVRFAMQSSGDKIGDVYGLYELRTSAPHAPPSR